MISPPSAGTHPGRAVVGDEPPLGPPKRRPFSLRWSAWLGGRRPSDTVPALPQLPPSPRKCPTAGPRPAGGPAATPAAARLEVIAKLAAELHPASARSTKFMCSLTGLPESRAMALDELERSRALLVTEDLRGIPPPAGVQRVAVLLPGSEPLFALVSQVLLPALAGRQVRAITPAGPSQAAYRRLFADLSGAVGSLLETAEDGSCQRSTGPQLGSIMLAHPLTAGDEARLSLAMLEPPDVLLGVPTPALAHRIVSKLPACAILLPVPMATLAVVAPHPDGSTEHLEPMVLGLLEERRRASYRLRVVPDTVLVHARVLTRFLAVMARQAGLRPPAPAPLRLLRLDPSLDLGRLRAEEAAINAVRPPAGRALTLWAYTCEADLGGLMRDLARWPVTVSLYGASSLTVALLSPDRLLLGKSYLAQEAFLQRLGGGAVQQPWWHYGAPDAASQRAPLLALLDRADRAAPPRCWQIAAGRPATGALGNAPAAWL